MLLKGAIMAVNVLNAFVGAPPIDGGVFYRAPIGQEVPTGAADPVPAEAEDHGAVGENGIAVSQERSSTDINMFGGDVFIDVQDNYSETLTLTLLEDDNDAVLKTSFGDANVEKTEATAVDGTKRVIYHTSDPLPISTFYVRTASGDKRKLYFIDRGRVSSVSEVVDVHNNVTSRQVTVKTFKPSNVELKGGNVVEFRDDGRPTEV